MKGTPITPTMTQLLDKTSSQHGFWLINHFAIISDDLYELLNQHSLRDAIDIVNDYQSDYMKNLYKKIDDAHGHVNTHR